MSDTTHTVNLKIADLEVFNGLIKALEDWVSEIKSESYLSAAERQLLKATLELAKE